MKIVKKNVFYCEFCKKRGLSSWHMKWHEQHCTGNMDRSCGICENATDYHENVKHFKTQMESIAHTDYNTDEDMAAGHVWTTIRVKRKPKLADIFDAVDGCPACVLTVLRGCGLCGHEWDMDFDWKKEKENWWNEIRRESEIHAEGPPW